MFWGTTGGFERTSQKIEYSPGEDPINVEGWAEDEEEEERWETVVAVVSERGRAATVLLAA